MYIKILINIAKIINKNPYQIVWIKSRCMIKYNRIDTQGKGTCIL